MKKHLKPSIKYFLIGIAVSQTLTYSLNAFNRHLEANTRALELKVEDYTIIELSTLETNEIEPCSTSSAKSYMDYRMITSKTSNQYRYIQEHMTVRDGYLVDEDGYIGVALGSWFGDIGTRWVFELSSGEFIYAVKIENKDDAHTINGCEHSIDGSVIEFVIDTTYFPLSENGFIYNGNFNNVEWWNGDIVSVRKEGQ